MLTTNVDPSQIATLTWYLIIAFLLHSWLLQSSNMPDPCQQVFMSGKGSDSSFSSAQSLFDSWRPQSLLDMIA